MEGYQAGDTCLVLYYKYKMNYCCFGCGQEGLVYSKYTKKFRCGKYTTTCPALIKKRPKKQAVSEETRNKISRSLKGRNVNPNWKGHTDEFKKKQSINAKNRKLGGYIVGSGRGKKGWYRNFFCDSSWELAYVIYCLDHFIEIKRNTEKRQYIWNGKIKNYIPDFIVNNQLIEIKGYKTEQWFAKRNANPDVIVLYEKDLKPILEYVNKKYGKDYIKLYE